MAPNSTNTEPHTDPDPISRTLQFTPTASQSLSTEIVMGVARASGIDPTQFHEALNEVINPSALDALFQPKADGTARSGGTVCFTFHGYHISVEADRTVTLQSELDRLRQTGANLLVCGMVPDDVRDVMSARLLGDATRERERTAFFTLSDCPTETALDRLTKAQIPQQRAHVLSTGETARAATQATTPIEAAQSTVTGSLEDVQAAVLQTLSDLEHQNDPFGPADLRFCFDSLGPFVDAVDQNRLTSVLDQLCDAIAQRDGMGQFLIRNAFETPLVQAIRSCFEIVVELRISTQGPEYRWHLQTTGFTTQWLPL
ncbi:DUF7504 family protein [Halocatena marina]|uniref:DUF7504 family protein n=1 Tax=Halocatena marina TaxID=2934937 RepID=UPI00201046B5|nr:HalOD1 output domain-containing protein [Halocatena marina]